MDKYGDDVRANLDTIVKVYSKKGARALQAEAESAVGGSGAYARGWTSQTETGRLSSQGVIYNRLPGLPHLLEHGHAKRGGGRVAGRPHISKVEQEMIKEFEQKVKARL